MKLGLSIGYSKAQLDVPVKLVQRAEELGYDSVWTAEAYGSDAVTPLAYLAALTKRIKLGTGIMQLAARTPAVRAGNNDCFPHYQMPIGPNAALADLRGALGVGATRQPGRQRGPLGRHVEPAVGGQPGQQGVGERELGGSAPGGHVAHGHEPITRSRLPTLRTTSRVRSSRTVACMAASRASWVMNTRRASGPSPSCSAARISTFRCTRPSVRSAPTARPGSCARSAPRRVRRRSPYGRRRS